MDSPVPASLTPDPNGINVAAMEEKCRELLVSSHRAQTFEGLLSLPVHLSTHNTASHAPGELSSMDLHDASLQSVLLDSTVFERWRQFGTNNGLTTDSNIATYLLHHFETSQSLTRCLHCQTVLPLTCPKCTVQSPLGSTLNSVTSTNGVIVTTAGEGGEHAASHSEDNAALSTSMATSLASFVMGGASSLEIVATTLASLQPSHLPQTQTVPALELKPAPEILTAVAPPSPSPALSAVSRKGKMGGQKRKSVKKVKKGKLKKDPYTCHECGTHITPKPKQSPSRKRKRAVEVQPYRCRDCDQAFPYRRLFEDHLFTQEDSGSFKCCHCHTAVLNPGDMRKHALNHTGDMPYKCLQCPLAFSLACNLKTHLRTHSGERPFTCTVCGRAFSQSIALKVHIRKHTGERPFPCPHCPMAFAASSNLSRHLLKHTGQKPYRCAFCSAAFSQPGSLKTHTRSKHTGERPYVCEHCAAAFSDHSTLWKHRRNNSCHSSHSVSRSSKKQQQQPQPQQLQQQQLHQQQPQQPQAQQQPPQAPPPAVPAPQSTLTSLVVLPPHSAPSLFPPAPSSSVPLPSSTLDLNPMPHHTVAQQVQAIVVSQGSTLQLATAAAVPVTSVVTSPAAAPVTSGVTSPDQLNNVSMTVLSATAAAVSQQQQQQQQHIYRQQQHLHISAQHSIQSQQQQLQEPSQVQVQQQTTPIEGCTFVSGVGWCFPIHQQ